jgi:hypothetical protein
MTLIKNAIAVLVSGLLGIANAHATLITYEFHADSPYVGSMTYTAPDFITSNIFVPAGSLDACTTLPVSTGCYRMELYSDSSPLAAFDFYDAIGFSTVTRGTYYYYFANGIFSTPGSYDSVLFLGLRQAGHLVISQASVPEPASLALLSIGLAGLGFSRRKKA